MAQNKNKRDDEKDGRYRKAIVSTLPRWVSLGPEEWQYGKKLQRQKKRSHEIDA